MASYNLHLLCYPGLQFYPKGTFTSYNLYLLSHSSLFVFPPYTPMTRSLHSSVSLWSNFQPHASGLIGRVQELLEESFVVPDVLARFDGILYTLVLNLTI